jgi:hypothetical protein
MLPGVAILFWLKVIVAVLVTGVVLLIHGLKRRSWTKAAAGGAVLACLALFAARYAAASVDEWSPLVRPEAVVGTWKAGDSRLDLSANGTFRIDARGSAAERMGLTRAEGRWELDDYQLTLRPAGGAAHRLRVVVAHGAYRIIEAPGDLDSWQAWTGFNRTPPSPAPECTYCE